MKYVTNNKGGKLIGIVVVHRDCSFKLSIESHLVAILVNAYLCC